MPTSVRHIETFHGMIRLILEKLDAAETGEETEI